MMSGLMSGCWGTSCDMIDKLSISSLLTSFHLRFGYVPLLHVIKLFFSFSSAADGCPSIKLFLNGGTKGTKLELIQAKQDR